MNHPGLAVCHWGEMAGCKDKIKVINLWQDYGDGVAWVSTAS